MCRAYLGKFYHPSTNELIFEGRANIGAVTLNLPMLAMESNGDLNKFKELIDFYSDMVFKIHLYTYEQIGKSKGSTNPLFYCEGGAWMSVGYDECIAPILEGFTASLGYIGLEETCWALKKSPLKENIEFATEIVQYLWDKTVQYKEKYGKLFTLYCTPAESLIGRFQKINREKYGVIKGFSDKEYMTNSYHIHVTEKVNPAEKMVLEKPMHDISLGGRIQYCEYPYGLNLKALEQNINLAMELGLYHGVNVESSTCQDCGHQGEFEICPKCGSDNVTLVNRCCGYLSFDKIKGNSRYNDSKKAEIRDRVVHTKGENRGR